MGKGIAALLLFGLAPATAASVIDELVISEVYYDSPGRDAGREWVELFNGRAGPIDLADWSLGWGGDDYVDAQARLSGIILGGQYLVVGGPAVGPDGPQTGYDLVLDFSPDLQNAGTLADAVGLFRTDGEGIGRAQAPQSAVIYGGQNRNRLLSPNGEPGVPDVPDAPAGNSLEQYAAGLWRVQPEPSPGTGPLTGLGSAAGGDPVAVATPHALALFAWGVLLSAGRARQAA